MIVKMKFVSISGHISTMAHVVDNYLSRFDIQLEQTDAHGLMKPFSTTNPYTITLQKAQRLSDIAGDKPFIYLPLSAADAVNIVEEANTLYEQRDEDLRDLEQQHAIINEYINCMQEFSAIDINLQELEQAKFIHYRFGKLPLAHYLQYEKFLADTENLIFDTIKRDKDFVWGLYYCPSKFVENADATFASLKFEPITISSICLGESIPGTPSKLMHHWQDISVAKANEIATRTSDILYGVTVSRERLAVACHKVNTLYSAFDIKKFANISPSGGVFTFSGWMAEGDANRLEAEIEHDNLTIFSYEEFSQSPPPPTLLKNPPGIRQFEFFTGLYGLPLHSEVDPTPFLAITYTILFGLMFGDVGHGLVLACIGLLIRHKRKIPLASIMITIGISAMIFGFLYGSIFGFEDILPALWRRPGADITGTLIFAAVLGVGLIVVSMLINIYNSFKRRDIGELLFGANGAAGLVFYGAGLYVLIRILVFGLPITGPVITLAAAPLVFVAFKHPLSRFLAKKSPLPQSEGLGQFIFNTVIELFETLLTYATNTISFVRVGAFAISHAGMMHVVLQLSQGAAGTRNWLILIFGNILVLVIEGLLVGIQVLRLDFYEMFSRFYTGGGEKFRSDKL